MGNRQTQACIALMPLFPLVGSHPPTLLPGPLQWESSSLDPATSLLQKDFDRLNPGRINSPNPLKSQGFVSCQKEAPFLAPGCSLCCVPPDATSRVTQDAPTLYLCTQANVQWGPSEGELAPRWGGLAGG